MPNPKDDDKSLDSYIKQAIETDFPMFKVKEVADRQLPSEDNLVGTVISESDRAYSFFIDLTDPRPILQAL